jgi:hypothetical protein
VISYSVRGELYSESIVTEAVARMGSEDLKERLPGIEELG